MSGRFPLLTDENVPGPLVEGLRSRGWDVALTVELFEAFDVLAAKDDAFAGCIEYLQIQP